MRVHSPFTALVQAVHKPYFNQSSRLLHLYIGSVHNQSYNACELGKNDYLCTRKENEENLKKIAFMLRNEYRDENEGGGRAGGAIAPLPLFGMIEGAAGGGATPHYYLYYYLPPHFIKLLTPLQYL